MEFRLLRIDSHHKQIKRNDSDERVAIVEKEQKISFLKTFRFNGEFTGTISGRQMPDGWIILYELCDRQWTRYWSNPREVRTHRQQCSVLEISFQTCWNLVDGDAEQIRLYPDQVWIDVSGENRIQYVTSTCPWFWSAERIRYFPCSVNGPVSNWIDPIRFDPLLSTRMFNRSPPWFLKWIS